MLRPQNAIVDVMPTSLSEILPLIRVCQDTFISEILNDSLNIQAL